MELYIYDFWGFELVFCKFGFVVIDKLFFYVVSCSRFGKELCLVGFFEVDEVGGGFGGG